MATSKDDGKSSKFIPAPSAISLYSHIHAPGAEIELARP